MVDEPALKTSVLAFVRTVAAFAECAAPGALRNANTVADFKALDKALELDLVAVLQTP